MYSTLDSEVAAAQFVASEPEYSEAAWIDAYSAAWGFVRPQEAPEQNAWPWPVSAHKTSGEFNPKIMAWLDAYLGPASGG